MHPYIRTHVRTLLNRSMQKGAHMNVFDRYAPFVQDFI